MNQLAAERIVAIIRTTDPVEAERLGRAALSAGLNVVEVALTTPRAFDVIRALRDAAPGALIGAGTVLDEASAHMAISAGAQLLVSPVYVSDVVQTGHRYGAIVIPGCATASDMMAAVESGADAVKIFPATQWDPASLAALRHALPQLPCVPTGGVTLANAEQWIAAGAVAVGIGTALTAGDPSTLELRVSDLKRALERPPQADV